MKRPSATTWAALLLCAAFAPVGTTTRANPEQDQEDPVQQAIRAFQESRRNGPNEITVVLPPPDESAPPQALANEENPQPSPAAEPDSTGDATNPPATPPPPAATEPDGPGVKVESWSDSHGKTPPADLRLTAPFPAKPLRPAPAGWRIDRSTKTPAFVQEVELAPGKRISLSIQPHILVPDADGIQVFSVAEPGFRPEHGYQQEQTVGAILAHTILKLDDEAKKLNHALEELQQILVALPQDAGTTPANPSSP